MAETSGRATVSGPVTGGSHGWPFGRPLTDLERYGYCEAEYFVEGEAVRYRPADGADFGRDGRWAVEPAGTSPYRTRIVVYRPTDPAQFNGTVVVSWNNVSAGYDLFGGDSLEILEGGFGYVGVTVQRVGVHGLPPTPQGLAAWDPQRYGSLAIPSDDYSFDIYSQVIWGSQVSLIVGVMSAFVAIVIGTGVGLISGYVGGWLDEVIMRFNDVVLSIPFLVLMIVVAARIGNLDLWGIIFVIGFTGWSVTARVVRGQVLSLKERMFVERGKMIGSSNWHIVIRHILPNAFPVVFANGILTIAISILSESVLAFLNLSVRNNVSWGRVIADAVRNDAITNGMPEWLIVPGLCLVVLVFGFYLFGYALDEILNPRLRRR